MRSTMMCSESRLRVHSEDIRSSPELQTDADGLPGKLKLPSAGRAGEVPCK